MNNFFDSMYTDMPETNRKYKDTVFRSYYSDKGRLLELYNAINDTEYSEPEALEIVTLENAIYMNMKNDLAFLMAFSLNIYEHQSTNNPNMPLRDLIYVAKEYQKIMDNRRFYSSKKIYIPAPRFVILYNGMENLPDRFEIKLSDLYYPTVAEPELELKVTVYNINYGHNNELMDRCRSLAEYAIYVDKVRNNKKSMPIKDAIIRAIDECIKEGILKEFLIVQQKEVIAMSIFEYDEEAVLEMLKEEYKEDGLVEGRAYILNLVTKMIEAGEADKVKFLSEDEEFLKAMSKKYLGDE